jgi:hypothetical protein
MNMGTTVANAEAMLKIKYGKEPPKLTKITNDAKRFF